MEDDLFLVFHLMITGRFKWTTRGAAVPKKRAHGAFDFPDGSLLLTEQSDIEQCQLLSADSASKVPAVHEKKRFFTCLRTWRRQTEGALDDDGVVRRGAEV